MRQADLYRLAELAGELGAERLASTTRIAADRISSDQFYVACIGQFKRGKSTLLNALIGEAILPAGVIPVTSVPTILRFGEVSAARVRLLDSRWTNISIHEIELYVSEEKNPGNVKGVAGLEIFVPSRLLASGMCLVDTPGLGSVFPANAEATREFIPHMDAVLVVVGADPPISGEELDLVEKVGQEIREMLFILNKSDRVSPSDLDKASSFARQILEQRLHRTVNEIFEVSALEKLEGRGPQRDWPNLQSALERLAMHSSGSLVDEAAKRAARRTSSHLLIRIEEDRRALLRPLRESEARIIDLQNTVERAVGAMRDLGVLLAAEQERISRTLSDRRRLFLDQTCDAAFEELRERLSLLPRGRNGAAYRRQTMRVAQEIARARLEPWLESEGLNTEKLFRAATQRFIELGNNFLLSLGGMGLANVADSFPEIVFDQGLQSKSRFRFHGIERIAASASPFLFVGDLIRGLAGMRAGAWRDAEEFLRQLLEVNSARVQSDVDERLRGGRKLMETEIRALLHEVQDMAENALERAQIAQISGAAAIQSQLTRLEKVEREVCLLGQTQDDALKLLKFNPGTTGAN